MRIYFECETNCKRPYVNTVTFTTKNGDIVIDRDWTEYGCDENGFLQMEWRGCYIWHDDGAYYDIDESVFDGAVLSEVCVEDGEDVPEDYRLLVTRCCVESLESMEIPVVVEKPYSEAEYAIYKKVQYAFRYEDAKAQVALWKEHWDEYGLSPDFFDYDVLVDAFFKCHDCNVAENDMWEAVITTYVDDKINERMEVK